MQPALISSILRLVHPTGGEAALETEIYRDLVSENGIVAGSPNEAYFKFTVPEDGEEPGFDYGPWLAQEVGLFDSDGDLIVIGRFPQPLPKYDPASGSPNALHINIRVIFAQIEAININYTPEFNLPWATDAQAADDEQENRIIDPMRLHGSMADYFANNLVFPEIETATNVLAITDNADGTITIDAGQTWLWRGMVRYSSDDFVSADRTLVHAASKTYHMNWHPPGIGFAVPEEDYLKGRFEIVDMTAAAPVETDVSYDTTYDRMLIARIVTDNANVPTITLLKNKAHLAEEIRWHTSITTAAHHIEGFGYSTLVGQRLSSSWGGLLLLPPAVHELNWSRTPQSIWQMGLMTAISGANDPIIINDTDGASFSDGSGTVSIINNRYQQRPVGRCDTNVYTAWFTSLSVQIKGKINA